MIGSSSDGYLDPIFFLYNSVNYFPEFFLVIPVRTESQVYFFNRFLFLLYPRDDPLFLVTCNGFAGVYNTPHPLYGAATVIVKKEQ